MIYPLLTIVIGLLAAWPWLVRAVPTVEQRAGAVARWRPIVGCAAVVVGCLLLLRLLFELDRHHAWLWLAIAVLDVLLGFALAFDVLQRWVFDRTAKLRRSAALLHGSVRPLEPALGCAAVACGCLGLWVWF